MSYMKELAIDEHNAIQELSAPESYAILPYMEKIIKHLQTCKKCKNQLLKHISETK